jgi:ABC-type branched-subunit amino acid transport system permease subunit
VNTVLYPACALVALVAFLYKLRALRRDREAALAILCVAFGLLFLTFLLSTPPVWTWVDTAFRSRTWPACWRSPVRWRVRCASRPSC